MIISKDNQGNWTPVATGNGTFVGTNAAFDAVKDDLPDNTVAYTTDDGTEEEGIIGLSNVTTITHTNKSTSAGTWTSSKVELPTTGLYKLQLVIGAQNRSNVSSHNAYVRLYANSSSSSFIVLASVSAITLWSQETNTIYVPLKAGNCIELYHTYDANSGSGDLGYVGCDISRAIMG
jgi:hypothetical protein